MNEDEKLFQEIMDNPELWSLAMAKHAEQFPVPENPEAVLHIFGRLAERHDWKHLISHLEMLPNPVEVEMSIMPTSIMACHENHFGDVGVDQVIWRHDNAPTDPFVTTFLAHHNIRFLNMFFRGCNGEDDMFAGFTAWNKGKAQRMQDWRALPWEFSVLKGKTGYGSASIPGVSEMLFNDAVDLVKFHRMNMSSRTLRDWAGGEVIASIATAMVEKSDPGSCLGGLRDVH